jgi:Bacterial Ig-like domain (group 2)
LLARKQLGNTANDSGFVLPGEAAMKKLQLMLALGAAVVLWSCGNGSAKLQHVMVSPAMTSAATIPAQPVQFTAQGTFNNNTTRPLTLADGIVWTSSNARIARVDGIGIATCVSPGSVAITATAPTTSHPIFSSQGSSTTSAVFIPGGTGVAGAPTVSGSASLTCVLNAD